jgi:hypothetical protein
MKIDNARYYCFIPGSLLNVVLEESHGNGGIRGLYDALVRAFEVPGKPAQLRRLSSKQKYDLIERQVEHLCSVPSSLWYQVEPAEILAAHFHLAKGLLKADRSFLFSAVQRESDLCQPVEAWLAEKGFEAHREVAMGSQRPDVVGVRRGAWRSDRVLAVELKNDIAQLKRGLDQMTTFSDYAHEVYLACTPELVSNATKN